MLFSFSFFLGFTSTSLRLRHASLRGCPARFASSRSRPRTDNLFSPLNLPDCPSWKIVWTWSIKHQIIDCFLKHRPLTQINKKTKQSRIIDGGFGRIMSSRIIADIWLHIRSFTPYQFTAVLANQHLGWLNLGKEFSFPEEIKLDFIFDGLGKNAHNRAYIYIAYVTFHLLGGFVPVQTFSFEFTTAFFACNKCLLNNHALIYIARPGSGKTYMCASLCQSILSFNRAEQVAYISSSTIVSQNESVFYRFGFRSDISFFTDNYAFKKRTLTSNEVFSSMPVKSTILVIDESQFIQNYQSQAAEGLADLIFEKPYITHIILVSATPFDGTTINFSVLLLVLKNRKMYEEYIKEFKTWRFKVIQTKNLEKQAEYLDKIQPYLELVKPYVVEHDISFKHKPIIEVVAHNMSVEEKAECKIFIKKIFSGASFRERSKAFNKLYFYVERTRTPVFISQMLDLLRLDYNVLLVVSLKSIIEEAIKLIEFYPHLKIQYLAITGKTPAKKRLAAIQAFNENKIQLLLTTQIVDSGLNIAPVIPNKRKHAVITALSWSNIRLLQLIGRVIRLNNVSDPLIRVIFTKSSYIQEKIRDRFNAREILEQLVFKPMLLAEQIFPGITASFRPLLNHMKSQIERLEKSKKSKGNDQN